MTDKYCDHGLYNQAVVVGSTSGSSTTLTVASVTSGALGIGATITGAGIGANTYISALGTGRGGAGTYTMSTNCTIAGGTTITSLYGAPALDPVWGAAQEGDGMGTGAATAATVSIDLSGATADAGDTFSIMGAVLTCVASGASTNQFNAGSGATLVSNLVTAINRTTNTSVISAQATGWSTPKIQDAVFARINGTTTTLDIMTRAGSAQYNTSAVAQSGMTGVTGPWTFSGGAAGAWGLVHNISAAIWPSGIGQGAYGVWGATQPLAGVINPGDKVYLRANNKSLPPLPGGISITPPASISSLAAPTLFIVDDGTIWTGDPSDGFLAFTYMSSTGTGYYFSFTNALAVTVVGKKIGTDSWSLKFLHGGTGGLISLTLANNCIFDGFNLEVTSASTVPYVVLATGSQVNGRRAKALNCKIKMNGSSSNYISLVPTGGTRGLDIDNIVLDNGNAAVQHTGLIVASQATIESTIRNLICDNFIVGSALFSGGVNAIGVGNKITFINPALNNVTARGPFAGSTNSAFDFHTYVAMFSNFGSQDFSIDNPRGMCQWNAGRSQPVLSALLMDGVTKWSFLLAPNTNVGFVTIGLPLKTPRIVKVNSLANGARTFKVQFCVANTLEFTKLDVSLLVEYKDTNGINRSISTLDYGAGALTASTVTWNQETGGQVTYSDGGTLLHNKYELEISTPSGQDLPLDAEVSAYFMVHNTVVNNKQFVFVDPDIGIA